MRLLCGVLLASFLLGASSLRNTFYGLITDDSIAHTKVSIPATAQRLVLYFWCEPITSSQPQRKVVLGLNRVPTVSNYDSIFTLPRSGEVVSVVDDSPVDSILYIGVWGGKMLHSYRYFGGSPVYTSVAIVSDVVQCDSVDQQGFPCTVVPQIPMMESTTYRSPSLSSGDIQQSKGSTSATVDLGIRSPVRRRVLINPGQEVVSLSLLGHEVTMGDLQTSILCDASQFENISDAIVTFRLRAEIYLERRPHYFHEVYSDSSLNISDSCLTNSLNQNLQFLPLSFKLLKPLPGYWTIELSFQVINMSIASAMVTEKSETSTYIPSSNGHENERCQAASESNFKIQTAPALLSGSCYVDEVHNMHSFSQKNYHEYAVSSSVVPINVSISTIVDHCTVGDTSTGENPSFTDCSQNIHDLDTYTFQNTATYQYSLDSDSYYITFNAHAHNMPESNGTKLDQSAVSLRGNLEGMTFSPMGGSVSISLTFSLTDEMRNKRLLLNLQGSDFVVYVQLGGLAFAEQESFDQVFMANDTNVKYVTSANFLQLAPSNASDIQSSVDSDGTTFAQKFTWVLHKPPLADLVRHQDGNYDINFYVLANKTTSISQTESTQCTMNMRVVFSPCLESTCKHGECIVSDDGMLVSSCSCRCNVKCDDVLYYFLNSVLCSKLYHRYPYAGEYCDELAESYWFYLIKVSTLVASNCAVFPGAVLAFQKKSPVLASILTSSGIASILYHLCDSDIWCVAGLSFHSLQVWDVLFATSSMAAVLIHHYPSSSEVKSAFSLSFLAFLVSPVTNSPTDPMCIVLAMGGGIFFLLFFWVRFWYLSGSCGKHRSLVGSSYKKYLEVTGVELATNSDDDIARSNSVESLMGRNSPDGNSDTDIISVSNSTNVSGEDDANLVDVESRSENEFNNSVGTMFWSVRQYFDCFRKQLRCTGLTLCGFLMVIIAFSCYIFQDRESYWIVHSIWHLLAMGSTYPFIKNKDNILKLLSKNLIENTD